jgi:fermentation-respiration switch protein FrsA (DUF1100 family)
LEPVTRDNTTVPAEKKNRQPMTRRRQLKRLGILLVCAYVGFAMIALFFSEKLLFRPHPSSYVDTDEMIKLTTADGVAITALHLAGPNAKYTILHSHGNGEDMGDSRYTYEQLHQAGFNVFAYDYHGYGTSGGVPTEQLAYADIDAAYEYLTTKCHVPPERIIVLGRSIGGGPSVDLATRKPIAGLVLESAFISAFRAAFYAKLLPWDKFDNLAKLPAVKCPVLVMHGENDWTVRVWHGRKLYETANQPKQCLWVAGAGHNNLIDIAGQQYFKTLLNFAATLDQSDKQSPQTQASATQPSGQ